MNAACLRNMGTFLTNTLHPTDSVPRYAMKLFFILQKGNYYFNQGIINEKLAADWKVVCELRSIVL